MKLADALITTLQILGVQQIFGVSGANIEHFHDAIYRLKDPSFQAILAKSEFSAAFMADGFARNHQQFGVCCATSGGGMMNLAVGIAESYQDGIPVLAIVGQVDTAQEGCGGFQDSSGYASTVDGLALWKSITKHAKKITTPQYFWQHFYDALEIMLTERQGPVALLIPRNLFDAEV